MHIPVVGILLHYFKLFFNYVGYKIVALILLVIMSGVVSSFTLTAIIPLMKFAVSDFKGDDKVSRIFLFVFNSCGVHPSLLSIIVLIVWLSLIKALIEVVQSAIQMNIITSFSCDLKSNMVNKYRDVKDNYFLNTNIGHLVNVISVESSRFVSAFRKYISFLANIITSVVYGGFAAFINIKLSLAILVLGVITHFSLIRVRRIIVKLSSLLTDTNKKSESFSIQFVHNFKYLKATSQDNKLLKKLIEIFQEQKMISFKSAMLTAISKHSVEFCSMCLISLIFYYMLEIENQDFSIIIVPLVLAHRIFGSFNALQVDWQKFLNLSGSIFEVEKTNEIFLREKEPEGGKNVGHLCNEICFKGVQFSYSDKTILRDLDLTIKRNSCIGVAGKSGSGKTTFLDLVCGLLRPSIGNITYDSVDYSQLDIRKLRHNFGYITQEPIIFNDTIENNITLWHEKLRSNDIQERLRIATEISNCTDFINENDHSLDEVIGDKGVRLSGGQRQRICIAREIFRDRDILIFDEATAALDTKSERSVLNSIQSLTGKKTMIIVAHRLSTLKYCDVIYVFDKGRIVEKGSWDELIINKSSLFSKMIAHQSE